MSNYLTNQGHNHFDYVAGSENFKTNLSLSIFQPPTSAAGHSNDERKKKISGQNTTSALKATDVIKRNKGRKFGFWKNKGKKGDPPHVFARALRAKRKKKKKYATNNS